MNTAVAAQTTVLPVDVHDPVLVNTVWGAVAVFGHQFVSKKDLLIVEHCLALEDFSGPDGVDHNVKSIVFRDDNRPEDTTGRPVLGNVSFDHGAIAINLFGIVASAIKDALNRPEVAILATFHRNVIHTLLHEIHHCSTLDRFPKDPEEEKVEEDAAEEWAKEKLFFLAKTVDLEPAHHAESSVLASQLMELLHGKEDEWSIDQRHKLDNHIMYELPETEVHKAVTLNLFKEYMRHQSKDNTDKVWDNDTITATAAVSQVVEQVVASSPATPPEVELPNANALFPEVMELEYDGYEGMARDPYGNTFGGMSWDEIPEQNFPAQANPNVPLFATNQVPLNSAFPISNGNPAPQAQYNQPAAPQMAADVTVYPKTGLTLEQTAAIVEGVYRKCYNHIFTNCGRRMDSDKAFDFPENVYKMGVALTEMEMRVVVKMDCLDANERFCSGMPTTAVGQLFGQVFSNTKLPAYKIYINMDGYERCRLLMPQNTAKSDGRGGLTKQALAARAGSAIMYIKEGNDNVIKAGGKTWLHKIVDNQFMKG